MAVAVGDVYGFTANRRWFALQVIARWFEKDWRLVAFATSSARRPRADFFDGAPIYVMKRAMPRNQALHVYCSGEPPPELTLLGNRPVALAFEPPRTYRISPKHSEGNLPLWTTWTYPRDCIREDLAVQPPPYRSRRFPTWTTVDPRALRAIDEAVTTFAGVKPATAAALRRVVRVANRHEREIDTISAEELSEKLIAIARRNRMAPDAAAAVIDATRSW